MFCIPTKACEVAAFRRLPIRDLEIHRGTNDHCTFYHDWIVLPYKYKTTNVSHVMYSSDEDSNFFILFLINYDAAPPFPSSLNGLTYVNPRCSNRNSIRHAFIKPFNCATGHSTVGDAWHLSSVWFPQLIEIWVIHAIQTL